MPVQLIIDADHGDVTGGVARRVDGDDPPVLAQRARALECAERAAVERQRPELGPGRNRLAQHLLPELSAARAGVLELAIVDEHRPVDVHGAVDVVAVHVGEHRRADVARLQAGAVERGRELAVRRDLESRKRDIAHERRLAGVDERDPTVVLDRPAVDRKRVRPGPRQEQVELPAPARGREQERALETHGAGRERVDPHRAGDSNRRG